MKNERYEREKAELITFKLSAAGYVKLLLTARQRGVSMQQVFVKLVEDLPQVSGDVALTTQELSHVLALRKRCNYKEQRIVTSEHVTPQAQVEDRVVLAVTDARARFDKETWKSEDGHTFLEVCAAHVLNGKVPQFALENIVAQYIAKGEIK